MPFTRPSLLQIIDRILADITSKLGEKSSILRRAWTRVWATAYAGAIHMLHGHIAWAKNQFFLETADDESVITIADEYGITRGAAAYAFGIVSTTGTIGAIIPKDTVWVNSSGTRYLSQAEATVTFDGVQVELRAEEVGIKGNMIAGTLLELESPLPGVNSIATVTVDDPISQGADLESIESLKARVYARKRNPPQGGAKADYEAWAREEPGLGQVKVYSPGEISTNPMLPPYGYVYIYFSEAGSDATPSAPKIAAVQAKVDAKKPVLARAVVHGIEFVTTNFVINATQAPGFTFAQMEEDIIAELRDLYADSALPYSTMTISNINEAISRPSSEFTHVLVTPSVDQDYDYNQMGRVGTVTINPI